MSKKVPHKSQFELMKFLKENPDPLGIEKSGGLKEYILEEVAKHNAPPSVWSIYKGNVYDITMYLDYHPGGIDVLKPCFGKDMTELFDKYHKYVRIDGFIGKFKVGYVKQTQKESKFKPPEEKNEQK